MFQSYKQPCLFAIIFLAIRNPTLVCSATFDVLRLSNVPFPSSSVEPVYFNASYDKNITEQDLGLKCSAWKVFGSNDFGLVGLYHNTKLDLFG